VIIIFNRDEPGYHDLKEYNQERDLSIFDNDLYKMKWLESCYNPAFKIKVSKIRESIDARLRSGGIRCSKRKFRNNKEVF
jgi:hypothetical protein